MILFFSIQFNYYYYFIFRSVNFTESSLTLNIEAASKINELNQVNFIFNDFLIDINTFIQTKTNLKTPLNNSESVLK